jgi:hypothetical protein
MGDALAGVAEHRKTNPDLLAKLVRGDLDWIVMKSLEKDRARRYEAADRLALDIQRHLEHRPVLAHAPSTTYRLHKFLRRHRSQAIAALAMVVVAGTIAILSIRNRYQVRLAEAEGARQVNALSEARRLIASGDLAAARKTLIPILESEHAGLEARILFAGLMVGGHDPDEALKGTAGIMERHYRERVQYYAEKIQANPTDPNNYLQRAQQYHYLHEEQNVRSDMRKYAALLGCPKSFDLTFGTLVNLNSVIPVLDAASDVIDCFSFDGLEMYIHSERPGGYGGWDLWVSRRASVDEDWRPPENLGVVVNSPSNEVMSSVSADGLTLYFGSERAGGYGSADIYMTMRVTRDAPWGQPMNMGPKINSSNADLCPWISADGLELYFESYLRSGGYGGGDIHVAKRATVTDPWGEQVNLGPVVNSAYQEHNVSLSPDGLLMFFSDRDLFQDMPRPGGYGYCDIWMTRRATLSAPWQTPVNLGPQVNGSASDVVPRISPDGRMFYFCSKRGGNWNNYRVPIIFSKADFKPDDNVQHAKKSVESDDGKEVEP